MEKFIIQGGKQLFGTISVKGAKNHALKAFAASILNGSETILHNVPDIEDILRLADILRAIGAKIHSNTNTYTINTADITSTDLPEELVRKLRASIVLTGPLLARFGKVSLPHPGGCAIGKRPIDVFINGFVAMGAKHEEKDERHYFTAPNGLTGTRFVFPKISVTGTETLMLTATLARGTTTLINAACEPEIEALANALNSQGAQITGAGTNEIIIQGVKTLTALEANIIPDRIEALSFLFLALASKSSITITDIDPSHIEMPLQLLKNSGAQFDISDNAITTHPWTNLKPLQITTREYPGFPTDGQPPLTVLLTQIKGESEVEETIFTDRLFYIDMLNRMGAHITMHTPQHITIHGGTALRGKEVESPDLRAGIAMIIAAVISEGETQIDNIYQIDRGYEQIDTRLRSIGVDIRRV